MSVVITLIVLHFDVTNFKDRFQTLSGKAVQMSPLSVQIFTLSEDRFQIFGFSVDSKAG